MRLVITKGARKGTTQLTLRDDSDAIKARYTGAFTSDKHFIEAARICELPKDDVYRYLSEFERGGSEEYVVELTAAEPPLFTVRLRGRTEPDSSSVLFSDVLPAAALKAALSAPTDAREPLIVWDGTERLAALDVDFHTTPQRPTEFDLERVIMKLRPAPCAYWLTRNSGFRFVYHEEAPYHADELAAVAAMGVRFLYPTADFEILASTRRPPRLSGEKYQTQIASVGAVAGSERVAVSEGEVADWLADRGLAVGARYDHHRCPVAPDAGGERSPVAVYDSHVHCYVCAAKGRRFGSHLPGVFPYLALIGAPVATMLKTAVDNMVHWEHARYVVEETTHLPERINRLLYSASLKHAHPDDPRLNAVFAAGANFVRFDRRWSSLKGETYQHMPAPILETLPACQTYDRESKKIKKLAEKVARFSNAIDISEYGYVPLVPIWGMRLYSERMEIRSINRANIVVQNHDLSPEVVANLRPRYVAGHKRTINEDQAWQVIERVAPGINRSAVKCLIAARGVVEGEVGTPPIVFITGPSKSAKSTTVVLSAAIIGDRSKSITGAITNEERARQGIMEAKKHGTYAVFNEAMKRVKKGKYSPTDVMNFVLNLTPESTSHELYTGPVPLGRLPVVVFTDTGLPEELYRDVQISRRIIHIQMGNAVDWESRFRDYGVAQPDLIRLAGPEYADACNVITSCVVDEFFREPLTFAEIAGKLGFHSLNDSMLAVEGREQLEELFAAVCTAPPLPAKDAARWKGRGWKLATAGSGTLHECWAAVCDAGDSSKSRRASEVDWQFLLKLREPAKLETVSHGATVAVRFVNVAGTRKEYRVNDELRDLLGLEARPEQAGVYRPGDASVPESNGDGFTCLPDGPVNAVTVACGAEG